MEAPAWCSVTGWHATVTTRALTVGYDTTRRVGTSIWPPVGTSTWPPVGTFSWPRTCGSPLLPTEAGHPCPGVASIPDWAEELSLATTRPRGCSATRPPAVYEVREIDGGLPDPGGPVMSSWANEQ